MASKAPSINRVGIIGSGSWATALAFLFTQHEDAAEHPVRWWIRKPEALAHIQRTGHNPNYLQSLSLDRDRIQLFADVQQMVNESDVLILAVPSAYVDSAIGEARAVVDHARALRPRRWPNRKAKRGHATRVRETFEKAFRPRCPTPLYSLKLHEKS